MHLLDFAHQLASESLGAILAGQRLEALLHLLGRPGAVRRLSVELNVCGAPGSTATANLAGSAITAYMQTGSQGGSFAGNLFSIAISDGVSPPTIIGTADASTPRGGQSTGGRLVSAVVPDNALGRSVRNVYLSLELPTQNSITAFGIDDINVGG